MRAPVTCMIQHQVSNELQNMIKKTDGKADSSRNSPADIPAADLIPCVFGMLGAMFFWAVNHLTGGALSIIPGHPVLDTIIAGIIIGVFIMYSRFKKIRKLQEIQEIQQDLACQKEEDIRSVQH